MSILNVRLPEEILQWIDQLVAQGLYSNRSEAIRSFLRQHIIKHKQTLQ